MTMRHHFVIVSVVTTLLILLASVFWAPVLCLFVVTIPVMLLGAYDMVQTRHSVRRLYPFLGRFRYMLEAVRPEIQQYFVESETSGTPIPREFRSLVYQRAKGAKDTRPFGTIFEVNRDGYEWLNHSLAPAHPSDTSPRVRIGGPHCKQPYNASPLNISAMSFGSLSKNAILALNRGARKGGFYHNTGEGGLSPYHLEPGGDLVWQIGTGYFGCRDADGNFDAAAFGKKAALDNVKMIEIKLSQGAKPGHGGILPAAKLTEEIASIREVPMGSDVISPAAHSAFDSPTGLLEFVAELRELSGGKPVGFKLCVGRRDQFLAICKAMLETGITPDFITVDGGEGGTGAAPVEMTNSVGTPLRDALILVDRALIGIALRDQIRIVAAGKMFSAFHMLRSLALGADVINSARGMMLALGCIQSRACNTDHCPTGIATQNPSRNKALVVTDKSERVANFQRDTVEQLVDLIGAAGLEHLDQLEPRHINRRVQGTQVATYEELYPKLQPGCLLDVSSRPEDWRADWDRADAGHWDRPIATKASAVA